MTVATAPMSDAKYLALVRRFPVRRLRNQREYEAAVAMVDPLIGRDDLGQGEEDYLDALTTFIVEYQDRRHAASPNLAPAALLRELMEQREMSVSDLGRVIGSQPLASMILHGRRRLSLKVIQSLAAHFGVSATLFMSR